MVEMSRLVFDFGLLVVIWMVQLIVYPSFIFYAPKNLLDWHVHYTRIIAGIVIPLMLGQLILCIIQVIKTQSPYTYLSCLLIFLLWVLTLLKFAPIHRQISKGVVNRALLKKLICYNWIRTIGWTFLCAMSASKYIFSLL